jgi:hypothetical protein
MKTILLRLAPLYLLTFFVGWLDYVTGDELDLFIFYFIPIVWAAWRTTFRSAAGLAVCAAALWFYANAWLGHAYLHPLFGVWGEIVMLISFNGAAYATSRIRSLLEHERVLNRELAEALAKVKRLSGRLPICMGCKSIQDEAGAWHGLEEYFTEQSEDDFIFSHSICPHCRVADSDGGSAAVGRTPVAAH